MTAKKIRLPEAFHRAVQQALDVPLEKLQEGEDPELGPPGELLELTKVLTDYH